MPDKKPWRDLKKLSKLRHLTASNKYYFQIQLSRYLQQGIQKSYHKHNIT